MTVGWESIPVDQRAVFWKVEDTRPRIAWLWNVCQDHATPRDGNSYLGLWCNASNFNPTESEVEQACGSRVNEMKSESEPGRTFNSFPVFVKPCG